MIDTGLRQGDVLVITDVQQDFLPGGSLAVNGGELVIEPVNRYARAFIQRGLPVIATRDWHPPDHCSFRERGGPWPAHCVAGTRGAAFPPALVLPPDTQVISKAITAGAEAYSAFEGTDLAARLRKLGCRRLFIAGLTTDYCVLATALDARREDFEVLVLGDAVRAVDLQPGDGERALASMAAHGARVAVASEVLG